MINLDTTKGFVPIYRSLLDEPIWFCWSPEYRVVFITLVLMVNHSAKIWEFKGKSYSVFPGGKITSVKSIEKSCGKGITTAIVRSALKKFVNMGLIEIETSNENTLIRIRNWDSNYTIKSKQKNKGITVIIPANSI